MRGSTPTTDFYADLFVRQAGYHSIPVSAMKLGGKYWVLPSGEAFEVPDHLLVLDRLGIDFDQFMADGAVRILSYKAGVDASSDYPSKLLDSAIFYLGSKLHEKIGKDFVVAVAWKEGYEKITWNEFVADGFKMKKMSRVRNTPIIRKISCDPGDPKQMRLSQNVPFSEFMGKLEGWRGNLVTALLAGDDARYLIDQKLYEKTGIIINWDGGLACGSFGCAFETSDPTIVCKITEDANEAAGAVALIGTGRWWPGLLGVHKVFRYPEYPVWVLLTERVGSLDDEITFIQSGLPESFEPNFEQLLKMSEQMLGMLMTFQRKAVDMILHRKPDDDQIQSWVERFVDHATGWSQLDAMRNTYEILWYEHHVVYPDVHFGNLGFRIFDGPDGMSPRCTLWDIDAEYIEGLDLIPGQVSFTGPEILCLDLGVSAGSGIAAAKKKRIAKLNPFWKPYINLIPEL